MKILIVLLALLFAHAVFAAPVLSVNQVAPGIYVHWGAQEFSDTKNHGAIANIGFIVGQCCVAVIDTGGNPGQGLALKNAIENAAPKPICYVVSTHVHPDHIYGNSAFKNMDAKFVGHEKLARAMPVRSDYYIQKAPGLLGIALTTNDIIPPDILVSGELDLDLGGRILKLTAHPVAHTDNDLSVYDQQTDTLWLPDLRVVNPTPIGEVF